MAANFILAFQAEKTSPTLQLPVLNGRTFDEVDQEPSGSWEEVAFTQLAGLGRNVFCHISTDVALRYRVQATLPGVEIVGAQVQAGGEKTFAIETGLKLWIK